VYHDWFNFSEAKLVRSQINLLEIAILTAAQSSIKKGLFRFTCGSLRLKIGFEPVNAENKYY